MKINSLMIVLAFFSAVSLAAEPDHKQPISVDADKTLASLIDSIASYADNVVVRQGSMLIKADKLEVDASAGKGKEVFITTGSPATYSQTLPGDRPVTAQANEIRFDRASRILTLSGNAEVMQSGSLVRGAVIRYNIELQQLSAEGEQNRRVTTIFTPENKDNP
ncbi:lipopolysaccharide transport periplasmic protein LptA [Alishewanella sp. SMS9]|nr:lipopolysaccharide transport periplasmic protein LptA [Alishewanella sp. SMS9]